MKLRKRKMGADIDESTSNLFPDSFQANNTDDSDLTKFPSLLLSADAFREGFAWKMDNRPLGQMVPVNAHELPKEMPSKNRSKEQRNIRPVNLRPNNITVKRATRSQKGKEEEIAVEIVDPVEEIELFRERNMYSIPTDAEIILDSYPAYDSYSTEEALVPSTTKQCTDTQDLVNDSYDKYPSSSLSSQSAWTGLLQRIRKPESKMYAKDKERFPHRLLAIVNDPKNPVAKWTDDGKRIWISSNVEIAKELDLRANSFATDFRKHRFSRTYQTLKHDKDVRSFELTHNFLTRENSTDPEILNQVRRSTMTDGSLSKEVEALSQEILVTNSADIRTSIRIRLFTKALKSLSTDLPKHTLIDLLESMITESYTQETSGSLT